MFINKPKQGGYNKCLILKKIEKKNKFASTMVYRHFTLGALKWKKKNTTISLTARVPADTRSCFLKKNCFGYFVLNNKKWITFQSYNCFIKLFLISKYKQRRTDRSNMNRQGDGGGGGGG